MTEHLGDLDRYVHDAKQAIADINDATAELGEVVESLHRALDAFRARHPNGEPDA